jgi:hypothetical protein
MSAPIKYKGFYRDGMGTQEIEVVNDFNMLSTAVDGVVLYGFAFDDMSVDDRSKYTDAQLERFTFLRTPVYQTDRYVESICNCSFEIVAPQVIIDRLNTTQFSTDLTIEYALGKVRPKPGSGIEYETVTLTLAINGNNYSATGQDIEFAFDKIRDQIDDKYQLKNCYGCQYGDYSVYGNSSFGAMLCYKNQKEAYNKVISKAEYMELDAPDRHVQEIYCCNEYEARKHGAGYRG